MVAEGRGLAKQGRREQMPQQQQHLNRAILVLIFRGHCILGR
jgi:hypothetical protein